MGKTGVDQSSVRTVTRAILLTSVCPAQLLSLSDELLNYSAAVQLRHDECGLVQNESH